MNSMLQKSTGKSVNYNDMAVTLTEIIKGNVFILNREGELLGFAINQEIDNERMRSMLEERQFPEEYTKGLFEIRETTANITVESNYTVFPIENREFFKDGLTTIVPIIGGGDRLGTLVIGRISESFNDDDLLLAEYGATVVGLEILHENTEQVKVEARTKAIAQMAISSLSFSELEAIEYILEELNGIEGLLVASKVADRVGITRSVIVNALRKLESAGVIDSRSLGMKGTYIKVLNERFLEELEEVGNPSISKIRLNG